MSRRFSENISRDLTGRRRRLVCSTPNGPSSNSYPARSHPTGSFARRLAALWNSSFFTYSGRQSAEVFRKSEELQAQAVAALRRACELGLKDTRVFASISFQQLSHRDDFKALVARFATGAGAGRTPAPSAAEVNAARNAPAVATLTLEGRAMLRYALGMLYAQSGKRDEAIPPLTEALRTARATPQGRPQEHPLSDGPRLVLDWPGRPRSEDRPARCRRAGGPRPSRS